MITYELDRYVSGGKDKKSRPCLTNLEKRVQLAVQRNKCPICGRLYKGGGFAGFQSAHAKALTKGGHYTFALCAVCHARYDAGECSAKEVAQIGITLEEYGKCVPSKMARQRIKQNSTPNQKVCVTVGTKISRTVNTPKKKRRGYWDSILY